MTREEAIAIIKAIGKHAIETHLTDPGDIMDATVMAIKALEPKKLDEVTGLAPCGCGGKADCNDTGIMSKDGKPLWWVECTGCGISTYGHQQKDEAKAAWNRAMSGGLS